MTRAIVFTFVCFLTTLSFAGSVGDSHMVNVALSKQCTMSSKYHDDNKAEYAVNNNTSGTYAAKVNCIHTSLELYSWWEVDLGLQYPVQNITVWARANQETRMHGCVVTVDGQECYTFPSSNVVRETRISCKPGVLNGRTVRLTKNSTIVNSESTLNICEVQVWICSARYWGNGCEQECGRCHEGGPCDKVTGRCDSGCAPGFIPTEKCTEECFNGTYGANCTHSCSENCNYGDVCNKVNGHCTCKTGFLPLNCTQDCPGGTYGQNCSQNCSNNCANECNKITGHCMCKPGWKPHLCKEVCPEDTYGQDCAQTCGACWNYVSCDRVNGTCRACEDNFQPPMCQDCVNGFFSLNCSQNCSENCVSSMCDRVNGNCPCRPGWSPPNCFLALKALETETSNLAAVAGSVVGVLVLIVVVIAVVFFLVVRRTRATPKATKGRSTPIRLPSSRSSSPDSKATNIDHVYQNVDAAPCKNRTNTRKDSSQKPAAAGKPKANLKHIPGPVNMTKVQAHYVNVAFEPDAESQQLSSRQYSSETVALDSSRQKPADSVRPNQQCSADLPDENETGMINSDDTEPLDKDLYYNDQDDMTSEAADLDLDRIQQFLFGKLRSDDQDQEFTRLSQGLTKPHTTGSDEVNYYKNRFQTILPYDDTRVVLQDYPDPGRSDYVNASYIKGCSSRKTYIAAQGPKENTIVDFWKMVWQEQTTHIVMLTTVAEGEKIKCSEYWPKTGTKKRYGSIDVTGLTVQHRADYVIRSFDVKERGGGASRQVAQYQYVTWPDHDVPTTSALVDFWRTVVTSHHNQRSPCPLLVHCSAGVGRTGAFIALDMAMDTARSESEINVFAIVERMREDRCSMIQTISQYRFVYEAILEAYTSRHARLTLPAFNSLFPADIRFDARSDLIDNEFKLLNQMSLLLHKPSHAVAKHADNASKNRTLRALPDDKHLVYLTTHVRGRNQYINAVYVPTFFAKRGCILTQLPMHHTIIDLWRLVTESAVTKIVSVGAEVDGPEERCCYWPRQMGQSLTFGPFTVTLTSMSVLGPHLKSYLMSLQTTSATRDVYILQYLGWTGETADNTADLLHLVDLVNSPTGEGKEDHTRPVVIQCLDGASKSGLLCAIIDVISRMTCEQDVDVFMAVRHVQTVRPQCVTSEVQYRYIYHAAQEYQRAHTVYNN